MSELKEPDQKAGESEKVKISCKWAESEHRSSEEFACPLTKEIVDSSPVGIFILDKDLRIVWVNQIIEKYIGFQGEELIGRDKRQFIRSHMSDIIKDPEHFEKTILNAYANRAHIDSLEVCILPGGERKERWLEHRSRPIRSGPFAGGRVEIYTDITARKQAEEALRKAHDELERRVEERTGELERANERLRQEIEERLHTEEALRASEEKYRELVEKAGTIILRTDMEGNITYLNAFAQKFFGYTEKEIVGRHVIGTIVPQTDSSGRDLVSRVRDLLRSPERYLYTENENIRRSGEKVWVMWTNMPLLDEDGRMCGMLCIGSDITEKKRGEEIQSRLAAIVESSYDAIISKTRDGRITSWNAAAERIFGYPAEEILGKSITVLAPPDRLDEERQILTRVAAGEPLENYETIRVRKDGKHINVALTVSPIRDAQGGIVEIASINRDITHQKQVEQEIRVYMAKLEQSNRDLESFASIASHDLQEPLRKVRAFGERLKVKYGDKFDEIGSDYLQRIQSAAQRMQDLVESLLTYSRVTTKAQPFTPVALKEIVRDVLTDLEVRIEQTGGSVQVSDLPTIEADPSQMRQLFQNLIANALKFHAEGKPIVKICSQLAEHPSSEGTWYHLFVEDNGIGFNEKHLDRIFAPFQRLHGRDEYEGTGMGLAICQKIVERHGGSITARSEPGKGATFIITLPSQR